MAFHSDFPRYGAPPGYGGHQRSNEPDPHLRIGDAERNQVAEALSQHYSDGRLDATELKERLDQAMSARTHADLAGLMTDLPPLAPPPAPPLPRRRRVGMWVVLAVIFMAIALPWQTHLAWPWVPRAPWLIIGAVAFLVWRRARRRHYRPEPLS